MKHPNKKESTYREVTRLRKRVLSFRGCCEKVNMWELMRDRVVVGRFATTDSSQW